MGVSLQSHNAKTARRVPATVVITVDGSSDVLHRNWQDSDRVEPACSVRGRDMEFREVETENYVNWRLCRHSNCFGMQSAKRQYGQLGDYPEQAEHKVSPHGSSFGVTIPRGFLYALGLVDEGWCLTGSYSANLRMEEDERKVVIEFPEPRSSAEEGRGLYGE